MDQPRVMGVLNVTPDSFSDAGEFFDPAAAIARGTELHRQGATWVDVGGESTRPGAEAVPADTEMTRVLPVIEGLVAAGVPVSIDTRKPEVMAAALHAGAGCINDINALQAPGAMQIAAATPQPQVCLMHMKGRPATMQQDPRYDDPVGEVLDFLSGRIEACVAAGIGRDRLIADPGFGFGKTLAHNLALLAAIERFAALGVAVMIGVSRKSMLGTLTGREPKQRLAAGLAATAWAVLSGVRWIRTHDVAETVDVLKVLAAVAAARESSYGEA